MEDTKTDAVVFTNYKPGDDLKIETKEIKTVEFSESNLDKIPAKLLDHKELENVAFNGCRFTLVENLEQLKVCQNLTKLTLKECNLQMFPDFLSEFHKLDSLNMSGNSFDKGLPDSMMELRNLETVDLSRCRLRKLPLVLNKLTKLKMLNIEGNYGVITWGSGSLGNLTNLETLNVSKCGLQEFPEVLCNLKSLKSLDIAGNKPSRFLPTYGKFWNKPNRPIKAYEGLPNLPGTLGNLTNLETLNVSNCGLQEFPEVLCKLKSLKALNIARNQPNWPNPMFNVWPNLPDTLKNLTNLESLNVSYCGLIKFPDVLCELKSLQTLNTAGNDWIKNLPSTLENLTNLESLNVSYCGLTEFPRVLCRLKSLKTLDFAGNNINKTIGLYGGGPNLSETLENLTNLESLNVSDCGLTKFPKVLCKLTSLKNLCISSNPLAELSSFIFEMKWLQKLDFSNTSITYLPKAIERCESLKQLGISNSGITEIPTVIFKMKNLFSVVAKSVLISVLDEDFVKLWLQRQEIFTEGRFQKMVELPTVHFLKPPNEIVQHGPEACMKYYRSLRADDAVNCSLLNVTVIGKTGAGKSSLMHSIKEGSSVLVPPSDRTVVVDSLEVKHEDVLLKIADFGGHDIYEITCPLFLKSTKQVTIVAVKLQEYGESNHGELVTKWLTTAASHMKSGSICIVATECDLCTQNEVLEKMNILKNKVDTWFEKELSFTTKMKLCEQTSDKKTTLIDKSIHYFKTSSLNMEGIEDIKVFLFSEAKSSISVLPKRWANVFKKMDKKTGKDTNFVTKTQYQTLFRKCMWFPRNLFDHTEESLQCLQFLHDSGMILWYGEKHGKLENIIFHNPSFPVSLLQCLFRHNLVEVLVYDHEQFGRYFTLKSNFEYEVTRFTQTGILSSLLLRYIWKEFDFSQELFDTMLEMLTMLDLCYKDSQSPNSTLRIPWFVQDENMNFLQDLWPEKLPCNTLQYTLTFCFCHRIPGVIYERFCVRLQRHLLTGGHTRQDRRDAVYVEQNAVQILFQRHPYEFEPSMQIHLRCSIDNLLQLQKIYLVLYQDMDNLCNEYSGLYIDSYFVCPHCLLAGSMEPTKRPITDIDQKVSVEWVPCDTSTPGSVQIPAALIFLRLFGSFYQFILLKNNKVHLFAYYIILGKVSYHLFRNMWMNC